MERIISLHNSGESFEKSVVLYDTARKSDPVFYSKYNLDIFYGHNLPKKNGKINAHGTVGFYEQYFSMYDWCPVHNDEQLWRDRIELLTALTLEGFLTRRSAERLSESPNDFYLFIKRMPMEIVFPEFVEAIKRQVQIVFPNVRFKQLYLEKNFMKVYSTLPEEKWAYSIFSLELNGKIGKYFLNFRKREDLYERRLFHVFSELTRKPVLSGNSAMFIAQIQEASRKINGMIGYREHSKEKRQTRDFALNQLIYGRETIIEPKNIVLNQTFSQYANSTYSTEELANIVMAKAYEKFLKENITF